jgi:type II secretory pathway pseudopilin PulG
MTDRRRRRQRGFTYLSLIILVAIIGLVAAATLKMGYVIQRSRAEEQLLDIGAAFSDALQSYADATPAGLPPQPPSLKDLLKDPRFPGVRRHLRQIFIDPMTGKPEWGIVYLGDKVGVLAVYSLSDARPVKIGNFPPRFVGLEGKDKLSEWRFAAVGKPGAPGAAVPSSQPAPGVPLVPLAPQQQPAGASSASAPAPVPANDQPPPEPSSTPPETPPVEPAPGEPPPSAPPAPTEPPAEEPKTD